MKDPVIQQANPFPRLPEVGPRPQRVVIPESEHLSLDVDGDPSIVIDSNEPSYAILRRVGLGLPRQLGLDPVALMTREVEATFRRVDHEWIGPLGSCIACLLIDPGIATVPFGRLAERHGARTLDSS